MTGPALACRRPYPRRPICAHKCSSIPTNAATDRPTDRTDRQTGQTDRQTDKQTNRQTGRQQTKSDDYRQIDKQTDQQSGRTDNQTDRAEGQTDRRRPTERKARHDRQNTYALPESIAVYGNRSHRQSRSLPLARALLSHVAAALMPTHAALCVSRSRTHTIVFS